MQYLWLIFAFPLMCQAAVTTERGVLLPVDKFPLSKRVSTTSMDDPHSVSARTGSSGTGSSSESGDEDDVCAVDLRTKAHDLLERNKVEEAAKLFIQSYLLEREECVNDASYTYLNSYDPAILDQLRKPRAEITTEDITAAVALFVEAYAKEKRS